jgi:hypothetical protein
MAASAARVEPGQLDFGVLGSVKEIEKGLYFDFLVSIGDSINGVFENWGTQLANKYYKKDRTYTDIDFSNRYLGYWTDNGLCYWYNPGSSGNYTQTLRQVFEVA